MSAAKLQYYDSLSASMRSSFVQLLDANKKSFALRRDRGDLLKETVIEEDAPEDKKGQPTHAQTFADLRKMAVDIVAQKKSVPAPHERVVLAGKENISNSLPAACVKYQI